MTRADAGPASPLEGTRWRWVRFTAPDGKTLVPGDSTRYWIELRPAGELTVNADCNRGHGIWSESGREVKLQPLATTLMACPPGSLDSRFLQLLGQAASYQVQGTELLLSLQAGAGIVRLARFPSPAAPKDTDELSGSRWRWVDYQYGPRSGHLGMGGHDPAKYEVEFLPGGKLRLRADCNRGGGKWSTGDARKLMLEVGVMTSAVCSPGSSAEEFVRWLSTSERYLVTGNSLAIQLADGGSLRFTRSAAPTPPPSK